MMRDEFLREIKDRLL
jgi:hypothetical protein